jgi:bifunctional UDP-N-acetylglucosamine pyrophosphorylase/glucosamine-1-phosphate N-acetyltransferase
VRTYFEKSKSPAECDHTLVLCADTPCLRSEDIGQLWTSLKKQQLKSVAATFCTDRPTGYGRIIRSDVGFNIVEEKDANSEQRLIKEVNAGVYFCETAYLKDKLMNIDNNNASGEFYLTDIFDSGQAVSAVLFESADSFIGVNDLAGLSKAYEIIRTRRVLEWTLQGVRFMDSSSTYIGPNVTFEAGSTIYPNTYFEGSSKIGAGVVVEPGCIIKDSQVGEGVHLKGYSYLESAEVSKDAVIGPYARLRPGSEIGAESKIGNFVEIKKAKLSQGVKVSHLSYVGDAEVGAETNIGCGFITCNYDGENKHLTKIGEGCFIGSDTQMIAPIEIGDKCYVASGSTINQSMPDGSFGISRGRQTTKEGLAKRFIKGSK